MAFKPESQWCLEPHGVSWCVMWQTKNPPNVSQKSFWFILIIHWTFLYSFVTFTPGFVSWQAFGIGHDASTCHRWQRVDMPIDTVVECKNFNCEQDLPWFACPLRIVPIGSNRKVVICCYLNLFQCLWLSVRHAPRCTTLHHVTGVCDAFCEILQQNVWELPPGSILAWKKLLLYTGSSFRRTEKSMAFRFRYLDRRKGTFWKFHDNSRHEAIKLQISWKASVCLMQVHQHNVWTTVEGDWGSEKTEV